MKTDFLKSARLTVFLFFWFIFLVLGSYLPAQAPAFGGGLGVSSLRYDKTKGDIVKKTFGFPQLSINIDYYFPDKLSGLIGKLYNPVFANPFLQMKGQLSINQFRINNSQNTSITTAGLSFLYFPTTFHVSRKFNFFIEGGYKAAWNNNFIDPFHGFVGGIGTRHKLPNDWYFQASIYYTHTLYDYLDQNGNKGFATSSNDGFAQVNFSVLKIFYSRDMRKKIDQARDSLSIARIFSLNAIQKTVSVKSMAQELTKQLDEIGKRVDVSKFMAENNSEKSQKLLTNMAIIKNNPAGKSLRNSLEVDIDSVRNQYSTINIAYMVDFERATSENLYNEQLQVKYQEIKKLLQEAYQDHAFATKFIPKIKELETDVKKSEEYGNAKLALEDTDKTMTLLTIKNENNKSKIKTMFASFDKADKDLKYVLKELEYLEQFNGLIKK
jgi:hypothetical protein